MKKIKKILVLTLIVTVSMFVGAVVYSTWIAGYRDLTEQLIFNSYTTHDTQNKLIQNYSNSYEILADCLQQENCDLEQSLNDMQVILNERGQLKSELVNLGEETKQILTELNSY